MNGDPTRVDWVDLRRVPGLSEATGRLGMTSLAAAQTLGREDGMDRLLLLVEDHELVMPPDGEGVRVTRYPIPDMGVPADRVGFRTVLDVVRDEVIDGRSVVTACLGGYGRTGTAIACLLVDAGLDGEEAIALVRAARPGTIEREVQEAFVRSWRTGRPMT